MTTKKQQQEEELEKHCNDLVSKYLLHNMFIPKHKKDWKIVSMFEDIASATDKRCENVYKNRRSKKKYTVKKVGNDTYNVYKGDNM